MRLPVAIRSGAVDDTQGRLVEPIGQGMQGSDGEILEDVGNTACVNVILFQSWQRL